MSWCSPNPNTPEDFDGTEVACTLADDALHARVNFSASSSNPWCRYAERLYHSQAYRTFYLGYGWLMILVVANFEPPRTFLQGQELGDGTKALLRAADVLWLALVLFDLGLQVLYTGLAVARTRGWLWAKLIVLIAIILNLIANAATGAPYLARALRPVLLIERMRNVRKIAATTIETIPRVASVVVLLVLNLMGHSILGFLLFAGIETGNCNVIRRNNPPVNCSTLLYPPDSCDNYFASLGESTLHMFELLTAVNFPTVALPAMRCNPYAALFFISYIIIAVYLLFNLALAVAYTEFYLGYRAEVLVRFYRIFSGLDKAFTVLVGQERGGAAGLRSAAASVVAWGEQSPTSPSAFAASRQSTSRGSAVGWDEIIASYDRTPQGTISSATFVAFFLRLRPHLKAVDGEQLSQALFQIFCRSSGKMDAHAFRRLLLLFRNVEVKRDPSLAEVDDALTREENLEIEVFCSGPRPLAFKEQQVAAAAVAAAGWGTADPVGGGRVAQNPLAAALAGEQSAAAAAAATATALDVAAPSSPPPPSEAAEGSPASGEGQGGRSSPTSTASSGEKRRPRASSLQRAAAFSRPTGLAASRSPSFAMGMSALPGGDAPRGMSRSSYSMGSFSGGGGDAHGLRALSRLMDLRRTHYMHATMEARYGGGGAAAAAAGGAAAAQASINSGGGGGEEGGAAGGGGAAAAPALPAAPPQGWCSSSRCCCSRGGGLAPPSAWECSIECLIPFAESKLLTLGFDVTTLAAAIMLLTQLTLETDEPGNPFMPAVTLLNQMQFLTLAIGLIYVSLRMAAWGPYRYWTRSGLNKFDAVIIFTTFAGVLAGQLYKGELWLGEILTFLRLLRLSRVCRFIPGFTSTVLAFKDIIPMLGQHVLILLASLYCFAIIGMYAFGGKLKESNPAVRLSSYGIYLYYDILNFDSLTNSMFCQFYLLTINDWTALMEGSAAAVGNVARLYYIAFWPINVLFLLNLIIAFITVAFGAEKDRRDAAFAAARTEVPESLLRDNKERGAFLSSAVFTVGVLDWRELLSSGGADVRGWLFTRKPRFNDVYDSLYKEDVKKTFPETLDFQVGQKKTD